jgi:hypothetical protein
MINGVSYPEIARSHCVFSDDVYKVLETRKGEISEIKSSLENPQSDAEVVADLFVLNNMLDEGEDIKEVWKLYPTLSKYNKTKDPNIQTLLAGVYRKTKIPDAFGPLVVMLIQNAIHQDNSSFTPTFDPNEEIGGAILDYLA